MSWEIVVTRVRDPGESHEPWEAWFTAKPSMSPSSSIRNVS
jgi:hypothetical protein